MEIQSLFGLPAHPLIAHAAIVLLPLAAIGTVPTRWCPAPGTTTRRSPLV